MDCEKMPRENSVKLIWTNYAMLIWVKGKCVARWSTFLWTWTQCTQWVKLLRRYAIYVKSTLHCMHTKQLFNVVQFIFLLRDDLEDTNKNLLVNRSLAVLPSVFDFSRSQSWELEFLRAFFAVRSNILTTSFNHYSQRLPLPEEQPRAIARTRRRRWQ